MKKIIFLLTLSFLATYTFAQDVDSETSFDMRSSGKIYVVVAVIAVIFIGLAVYLFSMDRRIKKIEQENNRI